MKQNVIAALVLSALTAPAFATPVSDAQQAVDKAQATFDKATGAEKDYAGRKLQQALDRLQNLSTEAAVRDAAHRVAIIPAPALAPVAAPAAPIATPTKAPVATPAAVPTLVAPTVVTQAAPFKSPNAPAAHLVPQIPTAVATAEPTSKAPNAPAIPSQPKIPGAERNVNAPDLSSRNPAAVDGPTQTADVHITFIDKEPQHSLTPAAPVVNPGPLVKQETPTYAVPTLREDAGAPHAYKAPEARLGNVSQNLDARLKAWEAEESEVVLTSDTIHPVAADVGVVKTEKVDVTARAGNGLFGQSGTAPANQATDYDEAQDKIIQALSSLANSGINHTQNNAQAITTVGQAVAQNAQALATTNQQVAQTASSVQQIQNQQAAGGGFAAQTALDQEIQDRKDADAVTLTQAGAAADKALKAAVNPLADHINDVEKDVTTNTTDIGTLKTDVGTNKTDITTLKGQVGGIATNTSGIATNKADIAKLQQAQTGQNLKNTSFINKNKTQDADIATNKTGVADNKAAIAAETQRATAAEQKNATDIQGKVDTSTYTSEQAAQDKKIGDNAAEIANSKINIDKVNDKAIQAQKDATQGVQDAAKAQTTADQGVKDAAAVKTVADANTQAIATNTAAIAGKVDQTAFDADQKLQDKAIADAARDIQANTLKDTQQQTAIDTNKQGVADNKAALGTKADKADLALTNKVANANTVAINSKADQSALTAEATARTTADTQIKADVTKNTQALSGKANAAALAADEVKIRTNAQDIDSNHQAIDTNHQDIVANKATETQHFQTLTSDLAQKVDNSTFQQRAQTVDDRFADTDNRIAQQKAAQQKTDATVAKHTAQLADHESRIQDLEANTSANFGKLKSQVEQNRKRASAGIAGVAAMANIPPVNQGQTFAVGAGVGSTDGESALSVGFSARASESVTVKASVSNDTQHNFVVGAGVSYGW
ncbi:YadA-like family protein [Salmonella enterica]|nr:YadA-like family protein [Salmonella enterica]